MIFWWLKDFELMKAAGLNVLRLGAVLPIHQLQNLELANLHRRSWNIQPELPKLRRRCHVAWCGTTTRCLQWKLSSYRAGHCRGGSHLWDLHFGWYAPGPLTDAAAKLRAKMTVCEMQHIKIDSQYMSQLDGESSCPWMSPCGPRVKGPAERKVLRRGCSLVGSTAGASALSSTAFTPLSTRCA